MTLVAQAPTRSRRRAAVVAAVLAASVLGLLVGLTIGAGRTEGWIEGEAHLGDHQVSVETDDWTYGASESVPAWIDSGGTDHESGWPDCLDGPVGSTRSVRFLAPEVEYDGGSFRPIVVVDCRG
jgi:hypothetical protein